VLLNTFTVSGAPAFAESAELQFPVLKREDSAKVRLGCGRCQ
jgi:hypothetical protein